MRAETKKRLLAVLEADLEKVKANLRRDFYQEWTDAGNLVTQLYQRLQRKMKLAEIEQLEIQIKKATLMREKAQKAALGSTKKVEAWLNERFKLEDEIRELHSALFYVTTDSPAK